jgi:hypothetical protein
VTHVRQKRAFGPGGRFGNVLRLPQRFLEFFAFGDVAKNALNDGSTSDRRDRWRNRHNNPLAVFSKDFGFNVCLLSQGCVFLEDLPVSFGFFGRVQETLWLADDLVSLASQ